MVSETFTQQPSHESQKLEQGLTPDLKQTNTQARRLKEEFYGQFFIVHRLYSYIKKVLVVQFKKDEKTEQTVKMDSRKSQNEALRRSMKAALMLRVIVSVRGSEKTLHFSHYFFFRHIL